MKLRSAPLEKGSNNFFEGLAAVVEILVLDNQIWPSYFRWVKKNLRSSCTLLPTTIIPSPLPYWDSFIVRLSINLLFIGREKKCPIFGCLCCVTKKLAEKITYNKFGKFSSKKGLSISMIELKHPTLSNNKTNTNTYPTNLVSGGL